MLLRIAGVLLALVVARQTVACAIFVSHPPQVHVRDAEVIVEAVATAEPDVLALRKVWKGAAPATISIRTFSSASCDRVVPIVDGRTYLIVVNRGEVVLHGTTLHAQHGSVFDVEDEEGKRFLRFLRAPVRVSRADVLAMLRGWHYGTITDHAFAEWLRKTAPVAETDLEDSLSSFAVLSGLDREVNRPGVPLEKNPCLAMLRTHIAPLIIQALGPRKGSEEAIREIEEEADAIYAANEQCAEPSEVH